MLGRSDRREHVEDGAADPALAQRRDEGASSTTAPGRY